MKKSSQDIYYETMDYFLEISKSKPKKVLEEKINKNIWSKYSCIPDMLKYDFKTFNKKLAFYKAKNKRRKNKINNDHNEY